METSSSPSHSKKVLLAIAAGAVLIAALIFILSNSSQAKEESKADANSTVTTDTRGVTDTTPPTVTNLTITPDYNGKYTNGGPVLTANVSDSESSILNCEYTIDNGNFWWPADFAPNPKNDKSGICTSAQALAGSEGQTFTFSLRATDKAENSGVSDTSITRTVDANRPNADVRLDSTFLTPQNFNPLTSIHGTMSDGAGSGVAKVLLSIQQAGGDCADSCGLFWDGSNWIQSNDVQVEATLGSNGTWTYDATKLQKTLRTAVRYNIKAEATDLIGLTGSNHTGYFLWNIAPAVVDIISPKQNSTTTSTVNVEAQTDKDVSCSVGLDPNPYGDVPPPMNPMQKAKYNKHTFTFNNVTPGAHSIIISCVDGYNLTGEAQQIWTVAPVKPLRK